VSADDAHPVLRADRDPGALEDRVVSVDFVEVADLEKNGHAWMNGRAAEKPVRGSALSGVLRIDVPLRGAIWASSPESGRFAESVDARRRRRTERPIPIKPIPETRDLPARHHPASGIPISSRAGKRRRIGVPSAPPRGSRTKESSP